MARLVAVVTQVTHRKNKFGTFLTAQHRT